MDFLPNKQYLHLVFWATLGKKLNLKNPKTFNEKIQWLKLYDHDPRYTMMADKYLVKQYVASKIGKQYVIPSFGVWDSANEIDFDLLPEQFVLKCNHNSGKGMFICRDKSLINRERIISDLNEGLKQNYFLQGREWCYKNIPRKIIAEEYLNNTETDNAELWDYKVMCFNGKVLCSFVCTDRMNGNGLKVTFFDNEWNVLPFERHYPKSRKTILKPNNFEKMKLLAEKLANDIPFVRVDFYEINGHIYFGEMTFYPGNGMEEFSPESADYEIGSWLIIPGKKKL